MLAVGGAPLELPPAPAALATAVHADSAAGYDGGHVYLIRPDAYVALSTGVADPRAVFVALERLAATRENVPA